VLMLILNQKFPVIVQQRFSIRVRSGQRRRFRYRSCDRCFISIPVGTLQEPIGVNNRLKPLIDLVFMLSLDPPKSPWLSGDFDRNLVPPFLRGARGDLDLIVKQQYLSGFKLVVDTNGQCLSTSSFLWLRVLRVFAVHYWEPLHSNRHIGEDRNKLMNRSLTLVA